jgi:hypothetical protein
MYATNELTLRELAARLILRVSEVAIRGDGSSRFLYIVGNGKSAEVSWHKERLWVEFWDSLNEDAQPVAEAMFDSPQEAESAIIARLT